MCLHKMSQVVRENNVAILESWQTAALGVFVCWHKYICQKLHLSFTPGAKLPQMWIVLIGVQTRRVLRRPSSSERGKFPETAADTELAAESLPALLCLLEIITADK